MAINNSRQPFRRSSHHSWLLYALAALLAVGVYFFGLDGQHIPKNGDEFPYAHITRLTAASGHLLPLQSELFEMRNTKPPLLFWQGIASTHGGADWSLWHLRYPSVIYTLLTALLVFLLAWRLSRNPGKGVIGALAFLAFFSTYRFGRPFLTNPPEVFWLFLPFFILLYWRTTAFASRLVPLLLGVVIGIGLLYKSFALLLPVGLCLALWYWRQQHYRIIPFIRQDLWKLLLVAVISLAIFSLWFVLDPHPQEIWQEFVLKENAGKFDPHSPSYLAKLLWGTSSAWVLALGYPLNAGLLAFPVLGLMFNALRRPGQLSDAEKMLWIWLLVMIVVFSLPSQRSSRYLLAAMPALAVLCALGWERISRWWFVLTLALTALVVAGLAYLSFRLQGAIPGDELYPVVYWLLLAATLAFALLAIVRPTLTRTGASIAVLLAFLSLAAFLRPFNNELGNYSSATQSRVAGATVWVPYDFNAKFELYEFLLPGADIHGYREERQPDVSELAGHYPLFAVHVPLSAEPCAGCRIIGQRLDLRGRHSPEELKDILRGNVFANLFQKEWLIESSRTGKP